MCFQRVYKSLRNKVLILHCPIFMWWAEIVRLQSLTLRSIYFKSTWWIWGHCFTCSQEMLLGLDLHHSLLQCLCDGLKNLKHLATNNYAVFCEKRILKCNIVPVHAMKAYGRVTIIAPVFIKFWIRWRVLSVSRCVYFV